MEQTKEGQLTEKIISLYNQLKPRLKSMMIRKYLHRITPKDIQIHHCSRGYILLVTAADHKNNFLTLDHDKTLLLFPKFDQGFIRQEPGIYGIVEKVKFLESLPYFRLLPDVHITQLAWASDLKTFVFRDKIY